MKHGRKMKREVKGLRGKLVRIGSERLTCCIHRRLVLPELVPHDSDGQPRVCRAIVGGHGMGRIGERPRGVGVVENA